ncbi:aminoacetone oxidase family FAD-binding enzyme [Pyramidobacter sp. CG50-2]|nr:aminoacetone oxidase family FAD-binding enzyme [Pyramidobacter sp. CG50-2]
MRLAQKAEGDLLMSTFDVVVVGGGPAGMMAAARAAQYGARTVLLEKNRELGRKLMITGRGRCNFAHDQEDPELLSKDYRRGGEFLLPALRTFGAKETAAFFLRRGVVSTHERGHRLYPREGQDASSVVNALWTALKDGGVQVLRGIEVRSLDILGGTVRRVTTGREEIEGRAFILATGGLSFPHTGSTGDGYRWARKAGHEIVETTPALCPIKVVERFDDRLSGLKLKNVRVTVRHNGETVDERFGEMDFTPFGISGAIVMDLAAGVGNCLRQTGRTTVHIDLKPALEPERLDARIERDFREFGGDALRFALRKMLPAQIIPEVLKMAKLDMGKPCGETTADERLALRNTIKDFVVTPTELLGFRHAIVTSGGVSTDEIEPETMASKLVPNLYFAGEMIDVDGPTGGYNLQECWSTGFTAGSAAAEALGFKKPTDEDIVRQMEAARSHRYEISKAERQKFKEEKTEDMTIKTGPTDDKEFCGWRAPRRRQTSEQTKGDAGGGEFSSGKDRRPSFERPSSEDRHRERRPFRPADRPDRPQKTYREDRDFGERRDFAERPRFSEERRSFRRDKDRPFERQRRPFENDRGEGPHREYRHQPYDSYDRGGREGFSESHRFHEAASEERSRRPERRPFDRPDFGERDERRAFERPSGPRPFRENFRSEGSEYQRRSDSPPRDWRPHDQERRPRFSDAPQRSYGPDGRERRGFYERGFGNERVSYAGRSERPYDNRRSHTDRDFHAGRNPQERPFHGARPFDEDRIRERDLHHESRPPRNEQGVSKPRPRKFASFSRFRKDRER